MACGPLGGLRQRAGIDHWLILAGGVAAMVAAALPVIARSAYRVDRSVWSPPGFSKRGVFRCQECTRCSTTR